MIDEDTRRRAAKIKLLLMDCDGVLTDGRITLLPGGDEQKTFHVRDGHGIVLLHRAGLRTGIISGRNSSLVERRAKELGIQFVRQGTWNKIDDYLEILSEAKVSPAETAFIGDDVTDIPLMLRVGLAVSVNDAVEELKNISHFVTNRNGGFGAVREICEIILQSQQKWADSLKEYFQKENLI